MTRHGGQGGVCAVLQLQPRGGVVSGERVEGEELLERIIDYKKISYIKVVS